MCALSSVVISIFISGLVLSISKAFDPIVEISNGKIRGLLRDNYYFAFESIPYAEPPINENRFESPKPFTKKWQEIRDTQTLPSPCMQWCDASPMDAILLGEEDCLYLNVYTPANLNTTKTTENYPVLFYIHGGAFMFGSGEQSGPENIMKEGKFIYVNFNYRLGPLGFLSTEDQQISGNMGLKDQLLALQWVQDNIHAFGGDPEQILLVGHSAGGASVHMHLLSGKLQNSVKAAISHSGTAFCRWAMIRNPLERTKTLAENVNCFRNSTEEMKNCLKKANAKDIVNSVKIFQTFMYNPFTVFGPVVESKLTTDGFLTENPENIIKANKVMTINIPWLVSYVPDEGVYNAATFMKKDDKTNGVEVIDQLNEIWKKVASQILFSEEVSASDPSILKINYLRNEKFSSKTYLQFQNMLSDQLFLEGIEKAIRLHKDYTEQSVYVYEYDNPPAFGLGNYISNRSDIQFGTSHADDVFLFYGNRVRSSLTIDEKVIAKNFLQLYENFITKSIPKFDDIILKKNIRNSSEIFVLKITAQKYAIESMEHLTHIMKNSNQN